MAVLDPRLDTIVIRVVYDGPPLAGKTTSLRTLASGLGGSVVAPEEIDGRTLYFDWLDYTGGLFDGRRIRCQIISVPGQASLASRRRHLIESADVVVFVADSTRAAQASVRHYLDGLQHVLATLEGPPVGIILQANKRDHVDAMPLARMRDNLSIVESKIAIIESVATESTGIREAFVFAVRLALDRVRELMRLDQLPVEPPRIDSAAGLLSALRNMEGDSLELAAAGRLAHTRLGDLQQPNIASEAFEQALRDETAVVVESRRVSDESSPAVPGASIPSGMIWPPVTGRMMLHEATTHTVSAWKDANGDWNGRPHDRWILHSPQAGHFADLDEGREALLIWARAHAACAPSISDQRCVVLAADGAARYRLWQMIKVEDSLRAQLEDALKGEPRSITTALLRTAARYLRAADLWQEFSVRLPLGLRKISSLGNEPRYLATMPFPVLLRPTRRRLQSTVLNQLTLELAFTTPTLRGCRADVLAECDRIVDERTSAYPEVARAFIRNFVATSAPAIPGFVR